MNENEKIIFDVLGEIYEMFNIKDLKEIKRWEIKEYGFEKIKVIERKNKNNIEFLINHKYLWILTRFNDCLIDDKVFEIVR